MYSHDLERVAALRRRTWAPEEAEVFAEKLTALLKTPQGQMRLRPIQAVTLYELTEIGGVFGPQRCGIGKTLPSLLAPTVLRRAKGVGFRPLLLVPASLVDKTERDRKLLAEHWDIAPFLKIWSYEWLGRVQAADALEKFSADLIVLDECFPYETKILTDRGEVSIGDVVEKGLASAVLSRASDGALEWKRIIRRIRREGRQPLVKVTHERGSFVCTAQHNIWTQRGYVEAGQLTEKDSLCALWGAATCQAGKGRAPKVLFRELLATRPERASAVTVPRATEAQHRLRRLCEAGTREDAHCEVLFDGLRSRCEAGAQDLDAHVSRLREAEGCLNKKEGQKVLLAELLHEDTYVEAGRENAARGEDAWPQIPVECSADHEALRLVQQGVPLSLHGHGGQQETKVLHDFVLCALEDGDVPNERGPISRYGSEDFRASSGKTPAALCRAHAPKQPHARSSCVGEDVARVAGPNIFGSGRQRKTYETTAAAGRENAASNGVRCRDGACQRSVSLFAESLQGGSCEPGGAAGNRGRWEQSQNTQVEISRSTEDASARSSRVVRVEVLERASAARYRRSGRGDSCLYDLEIEDNHNYFAERVLVSNCHRAKNRRGASVARRLDRWKHAHPDVRCIAMSGTITKRSLRDYAHILRWCLPPAETPLPLHFQDLEDWADALDEKKEREDEEGNIDPGELKLLCDDVEQKLWDAGEPRRAARIAFRRRLVETPGVVATAETPIDASLSVRPVTHPVAPAVDEAFKTLRAMWETPDGWPITDGLTMARHAREFAMGFFYVWAPRPPREWLEPRRIWAKFVRETLKHSRKFDSELQVRQWADSLPSCPELEGWLAVRDTFEPNSIPVWMDDGVLRFAAQWAEKHRGIIWVAHSCVGERLEREFGVPYYGKKGRDGRGRFIDDHPHNESLAASIASNKEGRNLQAWAENLILSMPSNGLAAEQLLSRTHRDGQEADEVTVEVVVTCFEHVEAFAQAVRDADYIESSTGSPQKLMLAGIDSAFNSLWGSGPRWSK